VNQKYLLGIATLTWGYQADFLWFAIPMAMILEARNFTRRRWALTKKDFYQVANLTYIALAGILIFLSLNAKTYHFITTLIEVLPFLFFSLAVVMAYSTTERMSLDVLFPSYRKQRVPVTQSWDMDYLFLAACLLATSINPNGAVYYFPYIAAMICWALYPLRQRRYPTSVWILLVCLVFLAGNVTHSTLRSGHLALKEQTGKWMANWIKRHRDPFKTNTAIGQIGELKLSDEIIFRISANGEFPRLLHEASYDHPKGTSWSALNGKFYDVPHTDDFTWRLREQTQGEYQAVIYRKFDQERALIPLPKGVTEVDDLPALTLRRNKYQTVLAGGLIESPSFKINYTMAASTDDEKSISEEFIPQEFEAILSSVVPSIPMDPLAAIDWLHDYFSDFRYSLYQQRSIDDDALVDFLTNSKAGHCEYFASTTALLLRKLGVPSRYVVGYSVEEFNSTLDMYIVRTRHAHAWAEAFVDGRWIPVDTTPGIWLEEENRNSDALQPLEDLINNGLFMLELWWNNQKLEDYQTELVLVVGLLVIILIWRIYTGEQILMRDDTKTGVLSEYPGIESPLFRIEQYLQDQGLQRGAGELLTVYLKRIEYEELIPLVFIHQRWRFDPKGLSEVEKTYLSDFADQWLAKHLQKTS